jgi:hypothetical protein
MGIIGLQWLGTGSLATYGAHLWTGPFGSTPSFRGLVDSTLQQTGKFVGGGADGDVDMGSTGTLHITTLVGLIDPAFNTYQLGVSAITCPDADSATFSISSCTRQIIGTTMSDRPWVTSEGSHVYIAYHDPLKAGVIDVQRSDDDGYTWQRVGNPVVSPGGTDATPANVDGNVVADPLTHDVYAVYAAGDGSLLSGGPRAYPGPNRIVVSRSTDLGRTWTAEVVYEAPSGTDLANLFPNLAIDPTSGMLYTAWSDATNVFFSVSADGASWSSPVIVNTAPAHTAVEPWLAAYAGKVDLVYYGTEGANTSTATWNVYLAQTTDGVNFAQSLASNHPNHVGVLCTHGDACPAGTRNLLDLFQVAIDPQNGKAAIIYTDDTLATAPSSVDSYACSAGETMCPVPQLVLAQEL